MLKNLTLSLGDIVGEAYVDKVCRATAQFGFQTYESLKKISEEQVSFFPNELEERLDALLPQAGKVFTESFSGSARGAGTKAFDEALHRNAAPLTGLGYYRVEEDGRLAIIGKSEHYQASLGHNFPGYRLVDIARAIGITNITHNNTRGHITRLLEQELVRIANGLKPGEDEALQAVLNSQDPHVLNRVINLETGSLVCEAAVKMMLARFYRLQPHFPEPKYHGKTPVFLVMGDYKGGRLANYHGTTVTTQLMRGMWTELYDKLEEHGLLRVVPVPINDADAFAAIVDKYDNGNTKVAGFLHELVLMNYGGIRLDNSYVTACHKICDERDIPVLVDEIQSCMWSPELFLFKEYKCHPDFVSVGKGFPGGMYPASRMMTTAVMDNLNLFGALVTNGQEELASLSNLITIRFAELNAANTKALGDFWRNCLQKLYSRHSGQLTTVGGDGLLGSMFFATAENAVAFSKAMALECNLDVSVQTYKADCPPAVLMKFPLISSMKMLDFVFNAMDKVLTDNEAK